MENLELCVQLGLNAAEGILGWLTAFTTPAMSSPQGFSLDRTVLEDPRAKWSITPSHVNQQAEEFKQVQNTAPVIPQTP